MSLPARHRDPWSPKEINAVVNSFSTYLNKNPSYEAQMKHISKMANNHQRTERAIMFKLLRNGYDFNEELGLEADEDVGEEADESEPEAESEAEDEESEDDGYDSEAEDSEESEAEESDSEASDSEEKPRYRAPPVKSLHPMVTRSKSVKR